MSQRYDVVILGSGLAGLTLAIQVLQLGSLDILVLERRRHPVAAAAHKVGESCCSLRDFSYGCKQVFSADRWARGQCPQLDADAVQRLLDNSAFAVSASLLFADAA